MKTSTTRIAAGAILLLVLALAGPALAQTQRPPQPPEYNELVAAQGITDPGARLKEFERIKATYPQSTLMAAIDQNIYTAKVAMAATLDAVLALQKGEAGKSEGFRKLVDVYGAAMTIVTHPNLAKFDKSGVVKAVEAYAAEAGRLLEDKTFAESVPEAQRRFLAEYANNIRLAEAMALLNASEPVKASAALEAYRKAGGAASGLYSYTLGDASAAQGRSADALAAYLNAAVENYRDAAEKARSVFIKINGKADGFEAVLEAKQKELPFHPPAFEAPAGWKGKAVLAELFTGSECPPCVGADLGFDGLIESVPSRYLVILEYHLPIPRPDPMMNPATKARQTFYGVNSTPSTFFDGEARHSGGGGRSAAANKYEQYLGEIKSRLTEIPALTITAAAVRSGDTVTVEVEAGRTVPGAEIHVVLVQNEQIYKGANGLAYHKLVVRDIATVAPDAPRAVFDLAASEKATDAYLTEFEKTYDRIPNFKFAERHFKIDRTALKAVAFIQDKETKKVHNAVVVDVK